MQRRALVPIGIVAVVALVGCGSDHPDVPVATAAATTVAATTTGEPETTSAPASTEPASTEPSTTEPSTTEPSTTEPATTEPATTEPATTEPATTEPVPTTAAPETTVSIPPATPNDLGLSAVIDQFREDEILHLLQVRVTNSSQRKIRITSVQLVWPGLTVVAPTVRSDLLSPGQVLDVPIAYGVAVCTETPPGVDETPPDAPAVAAATVRPGDAGPDIGTYIPVADQLHIFNRIFAPSCREQRVEDAATITFGPTWTDVTEDGAPGIAGTIIVERNHGNDPVSLTDVRGSVLLTVHAARESSAGLLTLPPGTDRRELPIVIVESGNCFPHALAESKKTFILPVEVSLDGEPSLTYELTIDVADRSQFGEMINESCGVG